MQTKINKHKRHTLVIKLVIAIISLLCVFLILQISGLINIPSIFQQRTLINKNSISSNKSAIPSNYSGGDNRTTTTYEKAEGGVSSTNGNIETIPPVSQWSSSKDGMITVYSPTINGLFKNGQSLSGTASISNVSYRLIDSVSGVIASGSINVNNGKFSGIFNFQSRASNGRLDIFSANELGIESSVIEIPVRLK